MQTDFLDLQPRYNDSARREFLGYFARRSLVITIRDVSKFEPLLSSVLTAGANYVHGIDFRTTELRKHRDAARAMALTAAREKADAMAATLNISLGAPVTIHEGHSGWWSPYSSWWGTRGGMMAQNAVQIPDGRGGSDDVLVPGLISVSANVSVTFDLVQSSITRVGRRRRSSQRQDRSERRRYGDLEVALLAAEHEQGRAAFARLSSVEPWRPAPLDSPASHSIDGSSTKGI